MEKIGSRGLGDGHPFLVLGPASVLGAVYVHSGTGITRCQDRTTSHYGRWVHSANPLVLPLIVLPESSRHTPTRAWRLYQATCSAVGGEPGSNDAAHHWAGRKPQYAVWNPRRLGAHTGVSPRTWTARVHRISLVLRAELRVPRGFTFEIAQVKLQSPPPVTSLGDASQRSFAQGLHAHAHTKISQQHNRSADRAHTHTPLHAPQYTTRHTAQSHATHHTPHTRSISFHLRLCFEGFLIKSRSLLAASLANF